MNECVKELFKEQHPWKAYILEFWDTICIAIHLRLVFITLWVGVRFGSGIQFYYSDNYFVTTVQGCMHLAKDSSYGAIMITLTRKLVTIVYNHAVRLLQPHMGSSQQKSSLPNFMFNLNILNPLSE